MSCFARCWQRLRQNPRPGPQPFASPSPRPSAKVTRTSGYHLSKSPLTRARMDAQHSSRSSTLLGTDGSGGSGSAGAASPSFAAAAPSDPSTTPNASCITISCTTFLPAEPNASFQWGGRKYTGEASVSYSATTSASAPSSGTPNPAVAPAPIAPAPRRDPTCQAAGVLSVLSGVLAGVKLTKSTSCPEGPDLQAQGRQRWYAEPGRRS
mmetsp:Transcript_91523/g.261505  ORF Transcript_91523/g.261505 Transcript_91523/m.261505 type:complete len:209 (+) Transcript_91523:644-1270(+)